MAASYAMTICLIRQTPSSTAREPPTPSWLRALLGEDFFSSIVEVDVLPHGFCDLRELTSLERLETANGFTDLDIQPLTQLSHVRELAMRNSGVTDAGLAALTRMHSLRRLYLDDASGISDEGFAQLCA